ncbi:MAG TPA: universal stress protein [bacterium]|nr:universal stress protein [bacterium]
MAAAASGVNGGVTIRRILVPLDGSRLAEWVLPPAASLARHLGARLTLLHVTERDAPPSVHGERHLTRIDESDRYLAEVAARCGAAGVETETHVHPNPEGNVTQSIVAHAADLDADLIVLATHGAGGARRALFGSVAQQVLRRGDRPVLLIRPPESGAVPPIDRNGLTLHKMLLPLDGEPAAEAALPFAGTFARAYGAEIVLLRVVPTLSTIAGERASAAKLVPTAAAATLDYEEGEAQRYLRTIADLIRAVGIGVSWAVARGDAAQGVLDEAAASGAELLIMASHGRTGLSAVFTGSVASKVVGRYAGPILLVRAPDA